MLSTIDTIWIIVVPLFWALRLLFRGLDSGVIFLGPVHIPNQYHRNVVLQAEYKISLKARRPVMQFFYFIGWWLLLPAPAWGIPLILATDAGIFLYEKGMVRRYRMSKTWLDTLEVNPSKPSGNYINQCLKNRGHVTLSDAKKWMSLDTSESRSAESGPPEKADIEGTPKKLPFSTYDI